MKNKKEIFPVTTLDETLYNIIEVSSVPKNIKIFKLYYGDYKFSIKEFEQRYGKLSQKSVIYCWKERQLTFIVDEIINNMVNQV